MGDDLTQQIIGAAIEVHRELGCGLLECIYEEALTHEFRLRHILYQQQALIDVVYKGHVIKGQRLDLVVAGQVIVELKSLARMPDVALAQVLSYLRASGLRRALIINFGEQTLKNGIRRVSL